jgi:tRNA A-37 threonylcarbamoyl transferase component Bud32
MAFVEINPRYQGLLRQQGLTCAAHFLQLPAVIISGHPDRNVAQVVLGGSSPPLAAFLKREHRVPWRDRLAGLWAGCGWASKSLREARLLTAAGEAGIGCPEWLAVGEDDEGRAFLLLRAETDRVDLRRFLQGASTTDRRRLAYKLGRALAQVHDAGFDHPDLYAKHVLIDPVTEAICFLDWQRSTRRRFVSWRQSARDLAALTATVAAPLASPQERLHCLGAYLDDRRARLPIRRMVFASLVHQFAERLLRRRRIREMHLPPLEVGSQNLIWLEGEALCMTREFLSAVDGRVPEYLRRENLQSQGRAVTRTRILLPGGGEGVLVRRRALRPLGWLWSLLSRRPLRSTELRQAGVIFRLQRHSKPAPRLLAVGQRQGAFGRLESFLLVEPFAHSAQDGSS